MTIAFRSAASRLVAVGLAACIWPLYMTALAQTSPHTADRSPEAAARRGGEAGQGVRVDRVCTRLFDGRGEKVLVQRPGREASASAAPGCRADSVATKPAEASSQVKTVAPSPKAPPITAGAAQVDRALSRDRQVGTQIAPRVSAGRLSATLVTGGTAVFLLQSSLWTYLLILGLPLWQHVDLLPIVDTAASDDGATGQSTSDADDDLAVTNVLDAQGRRRAEPGGRG
jgi:hypothetical protein